MSSRQNRADKSVLGPEDFMDEEVGVQNYNHHFASGIWVGGSKGRGYVFTYG